MVQRHVAPRSAMGWQPVRIELNLRNEGHQAQMSSRASEPVPRTSQDLGPNSQAQTRGLKEKRLPAGRDPTAP